MLQTIFSDFILHFVKSPLAPLFSNHFASRYSASHSDSETIRSLGKYRANQSKHYLIILLPPLLDQSENVIPDWSI